MPGKEQHISITASSNMSKDDIDKAVKEAEQFAAEDKKKREAVDLRNNADQMVYQTEKLLSENGAYARLYNTQFAGIKT